MRYAILLLFGGMGVLLLALGWSKFQETGERLHTWPQANGVVREESADGYIVQYEVGQGAYQVASDKWFGRPAVKVGDAVQVVYDPESPGAGQLGVWYEMYQQTAIILFFASIGLFLGIGGFLAFDGVMRPAPRVSEEAAMAMMREEEGEGPTSMSLGEAVELRHPASSVVFMAVGAAVAFGVAMLLFWDPEILITKWLSWPVAVAAIIAGILIALAAYDQKHTVLRAGLNGLSEQSRWSRKETAWTQVAKVVRLRRTHREYSQTTKRYSTRTVGYTWVLSDRGGAELIRIDENMVPREALSRLLRYIPRRTGLRVEEGTE